MRIHNKLQVLKVLNQHLISYPTPMNLNWNWNWGSLAGLLLQIPLAALVGIYMCGHSPHMGSLNPISYANEGLYMWAWPTYKILTGILLAMHYTAHVDYAFASVQHPTSFASLDLYMLAAATYKHLMTEMGGNLDFYSINMVYTSIVATPDWYKRRIPSGVTSDSVVSYLKSSKDYDHVFVQFVVGLLLGDGSVSKFNLNGNSRFEVRLKADELQDDFMAFIVLNLKKYDMFPKARNNSGLISNSRNYDDVLPPVKSYFDTRTNKTYYNRFQYSKNHMFWNLIRLWWYGDVKKCVPHDIGEYLTPYALAIWYMGDGSRGGLDSNRPQFATDSFSQKEVEFLASELKRLYGWDCIVRNNRIFIPSHNRENFYSTIKPYLVKSMLIKIK